MILKLKKSEEMGRLWTSG